MWKIRADNSSKWHFKILPNDMLALVVALEDFVVLKVAIDWLLDQLIDLLIDWPVDLIIIICMLPLPGRWFYWECKSQNEFTRKSRIENYIVGYYIKDT